MTWQRLRDPQLKKRLQIRAQILARVREFFIKEGFLEVETPILVPAAGQEPHLNPMKVHFQVQGSHSERSEESRPYGRAFARDLPAGKAGPSAAPQDDRFIDGYLITSPEYAHKKLLAAGFEKTFEITRAFRAGENWGGLHNPEFTMLEWYRAHADYTKIMEDVEKMVRFVIKTLKHKNIKTKPPLNLPLQKGEKEGVVVYQGKTIDLSSPWQRLTMAEAWRKYAHITLKPKTHDREFLVTMCRKRGYTVSKSNTWEDLFFKIFLTEIEPKLGYPKPTILYEWPAQLAALARLSPSVISTKRPKGARGEISSTSLKQGMRSLDFARDDGGGVAERFELYIAGIELANAFSELTNAREQRRRFIEEQKLRKKLGKAIIPLDEDFLDAVGYMPPSAGIAFGIDRLVMLFTNTPRIEDVLTFPAKELWP